MYAIVDLETTGGLPHEDKIIEIAIVRHDGTRILDHYSTLVNPDRPIPSEITRLTGINYAMVRDAPRFYEVAKKVVEMTQDAVFVAHNVRFDYRFLKHEFLQLGYKYERKQLCTVRLSKALLPGHDSYSLGRLAHSLGIEVNGRHRALGDATATAHVLDLILRIHDEEKVLSAIEKEILNGKLPPGLDAEELELLPTRPGIYYFYDANGQLLYIGKSNNIKKRVQAHFTFSSKDEKGLEFKNSIASIKTELTGTDLIAQLLESDEIKRHLPPYNVSLKRNNFPYGIYLKTTPQGYLSLSAAPVRPANGDPLTVLTNQRAARETLFGWVEQLQLCPKLAGLDRSQHACFNHHIGKCDGACQGLVDPDDYNARLDPIIERMQLPHRDALIVGPGRTRAEISIVVIKEGQYLGFGFAEKEAVVTFDNVEQFIVNNSDSRDARRILARFFRSRHTERIFFPN